MREWSYGPFGPSAWLVRNILYYINTIAVIEHVGVTQMPFDMAATRPVPDLASLLADIALAGLVKALQLECPIFAE